MYLTNRLSLDIERYLYIINNFGFVSKYSLYLLSLYRLFRFNKALKVPCMFVVL